MRVANRVIGSGYAPYVIAEIGVNHDGSVQRAREMVGCAAEAGADAIKLQFFEARRLLSKEAIVAKYQEQAGANDAFALLEALELPVAAMMEVVAEARRRNLHAIVTVFSIELIDDAERLSCDAYKTASPDIINRPLIEALIATGRPLFLSTGAATLHEIDNARLWVDEHPHIFMQCVSAYPVPDECAALGARRAIERIDPLGIGYSDHTTSVDTGALAVAAGACVLEKHLTYDRGAPGPDHAASLDPAQFVEYVRQTHRAWKMLGNHEKQVLDIEHDVRKASRQSLTAARDLEEGHVLVREDVTIKRPGAGLPPYLLERFIGRRLTRAVEADYPLQEEDFA